jgi:hypothetical protein
VVVGAELVGELCAQLRTGARVLGGVCDLFSGGDGYHVGGEHVGDLKEPSKRIPKGTLRAVVVTFVIYAAQMVWLLPNATREELVNNNLVMQRDLFAAEESAVSDLLR